MGNSFTSRLQGFVEYTVSDSVEELALYLSENCHKFVVPSTEDIEEHVDRWALAQEIEKHLSNNRQVIIGEEFY